MPTHEPTDKFLIRTYLRDERERGIAQNVFQATDPQAAFYSGAAEGWVTSDGLARLMREHIIVDSLESTTLSKARVGPELTGATDDFEEEDDAADSSERPTPAGAPEFPTGDPINWPELLQKTGYVVGAARGRFARLSKKSIKRAIEDAKKYARQIPVIFRQEFAEKKEEFQRQFCQRLEGEANKFLEKHARSAGPSLLGSDDFSMPGQELCEIKVDLPLQPQWRDQLKEIGGHIVSYAPPNVFRMFLKPEERTQIEALTFVTGVETYGIEKTLVPSLIWGIVDERIAHFAGRTSDKGEPTQVEAPEPATAQEYDAILHRESDHDAAKAVIEQFGGKITAESATVLRFSALPDAGMLAALARRPEIKCLAPYNPPKLNSHRARKLSGVDQINRGGAAGKYNGKGELVAIFDSGIDDTHPDFAGRIQDAFAYTLGAKSGTKDDKVGHGTHVAGIIAGTGAASNGEVRGMAPEAKLLTFGIVTDKALGDQILLTPPDLGDLLKLAVTQGAKIINLSWGTPLSGSYDQGARQLDEFIYRNPEVLVVVAAGNEGRAPDGVHQFNTVGTPASAKNAITVGACGSGHDVPRTYASFRPPLFGAPVAAFRMADPELPAALGSRGPTDYSSVKPDVSACGVYVLAAKASAATGWAPQFNDHGGRYMYLGGTSMAAPVVSGLAALVRQYLRIERNSANPSAALVKAILVCSAERSKPLTVAEGGPFEDRVGYPDFHQGFGRVDLSRIIPHDAAPDGRKLLFDDVSNQSNEALFSHSLQAGTVNDTRVYHVTVTSADDPIRVVLTWTDVPGNSIQSNLNVYIDGPDGSVFIGNQDLVFKRDPIFENAGLDGVPFDKMNNVEHIRINTPALGEYTIRVVAQSTPMAHQGYALCVAGCIQENQLA